MNVQIDLERFSKKNGENLFLLHGFCGIIILSNREGAGGADRMRRTKRNGGFLLCFLINLLLNLEWSIPAWILLALHLWLGIPIWWFVGGLALWFLRILLGMWFVGWAAACGHEKDPPKENKNPYSVKNPGGRN